MNVGLFAGAVAAAPELHMQRVPAIACLVALNAALLMSAPAFAAAPPAPDETRPHAMSEAADQQASAPVAPAASIPQTVSGATSADIAGAIPNAAPGTLRREIFGFALASSLSDPSVGYPSWNFTLLSTVAFFGLHVNDNGTIANDSGLTTWNSSALTDLVTQAHANNTKVVVTVIKQDFGSGTPHMCAALANRAATATAIAAQVTAKGVDGINIDYEGVNHTCPNGVSARGMMTDFAHRLRLASPGSYISVDTYASSAGDPAGFFDIAGLNTYVNSFFVMAYDLEYSNYLYPPLNCSSFCLGPTAPLAGYHYTENSTVYQYKNVVVPSKIILGVPYYGRKACVASAGAHQKPVGDVTADTYLDAVAEQSQPQVQAGSYAVHRDANDPKGQERWDTWYNTDLACTRELYWDDTTSLGLKYDLVNAAGLRGVGIWSLNYGGGAPELWTLLYQHFAACTSTSLAGNPASPALAGTSIQLTASSTGCPNPEYRFFIQKPGGSWTATTGFGSGTWTWSTAGLGPGVYGIGVWVREKGTGSSYDTYWLGTFTLTSAACASAAVSPGTPSPQAPGAAVTFSATSTGCPSPQYRFWLLSPGSTTWTLQRDWGAGTWTWSTTGKARGTYQVGVWSRKAGSKASYEGFGITTYVLGSGSCISASLASSPAPPKVVGGSVTLTGSSIGCTSPQYEFWLLKPGGKWSVLRGYGAATFAWNTSGLAPGTYQVGVWARQAGSTASLNAYYITTFRLLPSTCTAATISASPASPQSPGAAITLTAAATGCADPRYEFWLLPPPGTTWSPLTAYGSSASFSWSTAGKTRGIYRVGVWVRENGSTSRYQSYAIITFTIIA